MELQSMILGPESHSAKPSACLDENTLAACLEKSGADLERALLHAADCVTCRTLLSLLARAETEAAPADARSPNADATEVAAALTDPEAILATHSASFHKNTVMMGGPEAVPLEATSQKNDVAATADSLIGSLLNGKWQVDARLGAGGMGKVYAATHRNGRRVAIKMMRDELCVDPDLVVRFHEEALATNRVNHASIPQIIDNEVTPSGVPFLVMDLLDGMTLREHLKLHGPFELSQALTLIDAVLDAIAEAHHKGIIHRDIKPDNLHLSPEGDIRVLDFGLAKVRDGMTAERRTVSGIPIGTVGYMPPEQALGKTAQIDARSDVWSLAATLFTMLTGEKVHHADNQVDAVFLAMTAPVGALGPRLPQVPVPIVAVLERALAFAADSRPASARDLRAELQTACKESGLSLSMAPKKARELKLDLPGLAAMPHATAKAATMMLPNNQNRTVMMNDGNLAVRARASAPVSFETDPTVWKPPEGPTARTQPTFVDVFAPGRRLTGRPPAKVEDPSSRHVSIRLDVLLGIIALIAAFLTGLVILLLLRR
jgi:serine/threonine protein kinase